MGNVLKKRHRRRLRENSQQRVENVERGEWGLGNAEWEIGDGGWGPSAANKRCHINFQFPARQQLSGCPGQTRPQRPTRRSDNQAMQASL